MKYELASTLMVWPWKQCPAHLRAMASTPDDVDYLVWVPSGMGGTAVIDALKVCDDFWAFYFEDEIQAVLGPDHRGNGYMVTLTHS